MNSPLENSELQLWVWIFVLALPIAYGLLILWAVKYRFRSTTRNLLIAMTLLAIGLGTMSVIVRHLLR